ncbi:TTL-domain-containing protein [Anaeromyces robustus]|uniref:TTL-domain-containing protein n=1 Tax=Anaeromyces robustus TaxID=1754192 RepID=A0A1Y1WTU3_9FUNG|nr:TTL-domain-containing protein [Anaeromyces robustus]|eukprot:ORX76957.1 TTL-domain-containing protein [Anaeromyces robustus]
MNRIHLPNISTNNNNKINRMIDSYPSNVEEYKEYKKHNNKDKPKFYYKISEKGPTLLKNILQERGWEEYIENESPWWNLWWQGKRYRKIDYENCKDYQRLNHISLPRNTWITKKDALFRLLRTLKGSYGSCYNFFPKTFILPTEYLLFIKYYSEESEKNINSIWICKPTDLSRGRGIFIIKSLNELTYNSRIVLQRYIKDPLLISGYKFDLRCYVMVKGTYPLNIYLYEEGLARFATNKYDTNDITNVFSHLTNTSINKLSPELNSTKEKVGSGCKWSLKKLRNYFKENDIDFEIIWNKIKAIIILTLLPAIYETKDDNSQCFELFGFDIIIDNSLKPWLLEVNLSPALNNECHIDTIVKTALLNDVVNLLEVENTDLLKLAQIDATEYNNHNKYGNKFIPINEHYNKNSNKKDNKKKMHISNSKEEIGNFKKIFPFNIVTKSMFPQDQLRNVNTLSYHLY